MGIYGRKKITNVIFLLSWVAGQDRSFRCAVLRHHGSWMLYCNVEVTQGNPAIQQLFPLAMDVNMDCLGGWRIGCRLIIVGMILHSFKVQLPLVSSELWVQKGKESSGLVSLAPSFLRL